MTPQQPKILTIKRMASDLRCGGKSVRITQAPPDRLSACSLDREDQPVRPVRVG